jgi:hypothetical protein
MANSDKAYIWTCQDYSENELVTETFALRFKSAATALDFKEVTNMLFLFLTHSDNRNSKRPARQR